MQKALKWRLYRNGASVIYSMNEHQRSMCEAIDYNRMVKYNSSPFPAPVMKEIIGSDIGLAPARH